MGLGLGRGLAKNAQATTPGAWLGRGFGRGPWGLGLKSGVGRASKVTWRALNGQTKLMTSTQAPNPSPQPKPHGREFGFLFHVSTHAPRPTTTIPHNQILYKLVFSSDWCIKDFYTVSFDKLNNYEISLFRCIFCFFLIRSSHNC
ncbi:hypothetical protein Hanom_Chr01g00061241 [Helianthus anomalus]